MNSVNPKPPSRLRSWLRAAEAKCANQLTERRALRGQHRASIAPWAFATLARPLPPRPGCCRGSLQFFFIQCPMLYCRRGAILAGFHAAADLIMRRRSAVVLLAKASIAVEFKAAYARPATSKSKFTDRQTPRLATELLCARALEPGSADFRALKGRRSAMHYPAQRKGPLGARCSGRAPRDAPHQRPEQ